MKRASFPEAALPHCPVCDSTSLPAFIAGPHRMYRCRMCRTAFVFPQPTQEELERFYASFHLSTAHGGWYDEAEERVEADLSARLALLRRFAGPGRLELLDVGCGKGSFARLCLDAGMHAEGVDLSDLAVQHARGRGVNTYHGALESLASSLPKYGAVTLWATIEHLPHPAATLPAIHGVLKPGGLLFLDTGIGDDWLDRLLPGVAQWYDPPQHLFVFSAPGIQTLLGHAGFEVVHLDRCFERSVARAVARTARGLLAASSLRAVAALFRLRGGTFDVTRFPLGNLMSVVARKP